MIVLGFFWCVCGGFILCAFFVDINISIRLKELRKRDRNIFCSLLFCRDVFFFFFFFFYIGVEFGAQLTQKLCYLSR